MRRAVAALLILATLAFMNAAAAKERGVTVNLRAGENASSPVAKTVTLYSKSHALVIGIDKYTKGWPRLSKAVEDARRVATELKRKGFNVSLKTDLKSRELSTALKEFFAIKGADPEARLFLWYAGHGHTMNGEGFLVPADAPSPTDPRFKVRALHMRDFGGLMRLAEAKHVLSVFDSCFSGTIFQARAGAAPAAVTDKTIKPVRQFITSGDAGQQVRDDGSFREYFVRALRGEERADFNRDGYVTGEELGLFLSQRVAALTQAAQTPKAGKLHDVRFNQGDFVFVLPGGAAKAPAPKAEQGGDPYELSFWNSIKDSPNPADYKAYLEAYPQGKFAPLARVRAKPRPSGDAAPTRTAKLTPPSIPAKGALDARRVERGVSDFLTPFTGTEHETGPFRPPVYFDDIEARQRDKSVDVTLRGFGLGFEKGSGIPFGDVKVVATPRGDDITHVRLALPNAFPVVNSGEKECELSGRNGTWEGEWSKKAESFPVVLLGLDDVTLVCGENTLLRADAMAIKSDLKNKGGRWSGQGTVEIKGLEFKPDRHSKEGLRADYLGFSANLGGLDLAQRAFLVAQQGGAYWPSALAFTAIPLDLFAFEGSRGAWRLADTAELELKADGARLVLDGDDGTVQGDFNIRLSSKNLSRDPLDLRIAYEHDGIMVFEREITMPRRMRLDMTLEGVPVDALTPPRLQKNLDKPEKMLKASKRLRIHKAEAETSGGRAKATGDIRYGGSSESPVLGSIRIEATNAVDVILDVMENNKDARKPRFRTALAKTLAWLGAKRGGPKSIKVVFGKGGQVTFNGKREREIEKRFEKFMRQGRK